MKKSTRRQFLETTTALVSGMVLSSPKLIGAHAFIRDLKNAMIRIENKTYGICRMTGKLINKKRLLLVPHATLSIEAKNMQK